MQSRILSELNLAEVYKGLVNDNKEFFNTIEQPYEDVEEGFKKEILEIEEKIGLIINGSMYEIIRKLENEVLENSESIRIYLLFSSELIEVSRLTMNLKIKLDYIINGVPESEWKFIEKQSSLFLECVVCYKKVRREPGLYWQGKKGIYCNDCWSNLEQEREEKKPFLSSEHFREEYEAFKVWESEYFEQ